MKAISASIVVFTGAAMFVAGAFHQHTDTKMVVCAAGMVVGLIGLVAWLNALRSRD
jgi:hypothetical protein